MKLTKRCVLLCAGVLNEIVWRNMSTDAWVNFKTLALTASIFLFFFITQTGLLSKYSITDGRLSSPSGPKTLAVRRILAKWGINNAALRYRQHRLWLTRRVIIGIIWRSTRRCLLSCGPR
jgi:hypothetical protein